MAIGARTFGTYFFERAGNNWVETAYLTASNAEANDRFGSAVSLSADSNTLVVGANYESSFASGVNGFEFDNTKSRSGAAYVFTSNNGNWEQQAYVKASDTDGFAWFGNSISLSADGSALAVGSKYKRVGGAAYLY